MMQIKLVQGDITSVNVQAIVNAANEQLILGAGVAGAIRQRGGPEIQQQCDVLAPLATGDAVITAAGDLPHEYVIHAVAPRVEMKNWRALLRTCVQSIIACAEEKQIESIALPALGTGVFALPLETAAEIIVHTLRESSGHDGYLKEVVICLFDPQAFNIFDKYFTPK